ncbi:hypothetical protein EV368DRAFT_82947 [Lentinula lateritia]|nr:hypothetical protein EV368DRAFT_82947 [Lentinula lateritia]
MSELIIRHRAELASFTHRDCATLRDENKRVTYVSHTLSLLITRSFRFLVLLDSDTPWIRVTQRNDHDGSSPSNLQHFPTPYPSIFPLPYPTPDQPTPSPVHIIPRHFYPSAFALRSPPPPPFIHSFNVTVTVTVDQLHGRNRSARVQNAIPTAAPAIVHMKELVESPSIHRFIVAFPFRVIVVHAIIQSFTSTPVFPLFPISCNTYLTVFAPMFLMSRT